MPTPPSRAGAFVVQDDDGGRLDQFLVRRVPGCSRRLARHAISSGTVVVNGRPGRKGQSVQPGDMVHVDFAAMDRDPTPQPELAVRILYADESVLAVDKPAGMPSVALRPGDRDTVANYLLGRYPELRAVGGSALEAGLAHRLDTGTSGVLLAARTAAAWQALRQQFKRRQVDKLYLAAVAGDVARGGVIEIPIAHHPRRRREMCVCPQPEAARTLGARPAITRFRPLRRADGSTLLAVRIRTGVRHQIRVHLASIGHPVRGDGLYGAADAARAAPRLLLHAAWLGFAHPTGGHRVVIRSPVPDAFQILRRDQSGAP